MQQQRSMATPFKKIKVDYTRLRKFYAILHQRYCKQIHTAQLFTQIKPAC